MQKRKVTIIGAGPTGLTLALFLTRRNYAVEIFERRPDPRQFGFSGGRSINLALSTRGIETLKELGLMESVMKEAIPMRGRMIHLKNGETRFSPYGTRAEHAIFALSRGELTLKLLAATEDSPHINIHFRKKCIAADLKNKQLRFDSTSSLSYERCIGTDGSASIIRDSLQNFLPANSVRFERFDLTHAYKEMYIPPKTALEKDKEALHIWPRHSFMLIALPNSDGSFTCTLFLENTIFQKLNTPDAVKNFFLQEFPDVMKLCPGFTDDFLQTPTSHLSTIHFAPWNYRDEMLLMGDAAHAVVPFYGQGMNCCFEDCSQFNQILIDEGEDFLRSFERFSSERKPDADAISRMALENFIEMRDHTADEKFLLQKKIEQFLSLNFPEQYFSQYHLVTFSQKAYRYAEAEGIRQRALLQQFAKDIHYDESRMQELLKHPLLQEFLNPKKLER